MTSARPTKTCRALKFVFSRGPTWGYPRTKRAFLSSIGFSKWKARSTHESMSALTSVGWAHPTAQEHRPIGISVCVDERLLNENYVRLRIEKLMEQNVESC